MKKNNLIILTICSLLFQTWNLHAQQQTLEISNLGKKQGELYIAWYNSSADFRESSKAVYSRIVAVTGKELIAVPFDSIQAGTYAIAVFFDRNKNGKLDTNLFGVPTEKYGFSNNVYPLVRAASFEEAALKVGTAPATISIRLK